MINLEMWCCHKLQPSLDTEVCCSQKMLTSSRQKRSWCNPLALGMIGDLGSRSKSNSKETSWPYLLILKNHVSSAKTECQMSDNTIRVVIDDHLLEAFVGNLPSLNHNTIVQ